MFVLIEGLIQAEIDLASLLETKATKLGRLDLAYLNFKLEKHHTPFVGCKMRGHYIEQLKEMKNLTKCPPLARYLGLVEQVGTIRHKA